MANPGSVFGGWSGGGCSGTGTTCSLTINSTRTIIGTFTQATVAQERLTNISTRSRVGTGDNVQIGGFIIGGTQPKTVLIRARGPTLSDFGVAGALADPLLRLFSEQTVIAQNDNWQVTDPLCISPAAGCGGQAQIIATGLDPCQPTGFPGHPPTPTGCSRESVILVTLPPGGYTAIMSGADGGTGVGLIEVFEVGAASTAKLSNISTRGVVGSGDDVMIGGFIVGGTNPKTVLIRARGPTLSDFGVAGALADPILRLFSEQTVIAQNDNWQATDPLCISPAAGCGGQAQIVATGLDPCQPTNLPGHPPTPTGCSRESAILVTLPPGGYTAIMSGADGRTGVGLIEVFEVAAAAPGTLLAVRTFYEDLATPAGSGVVIKVNGVNLGQTGPDGSLTVAVPPGTVNVRAFEPQLAGGFGTIDLAPDASGTLDIVMEGEGLVEPSTLKIDEAQNGIVDRNFNAFTLRFVNAANQTVVLTGFDDAFLEARNFSNINLTSFFTVQPNGTIGTPIAPIFVDTLRSFLQGIDGEIEINVHGTDAEGLSYNGRVKFYVGRFTINGTLAAPPSNLALSVGNIPVKATLLGLGGDIVFETVSDAQGRFTFSSIPAGPVAFDVTTTQSGQVYSGFGAFSMDGNKNVTLNLLTTADMVNGVPSIVVTTVANFALENLGEVMTGAAAAAVALPLDATLSVSGGAQNARITNTATFNIPAGTQKVFLRYTVSSAEYPQFVLDQSQFDDTWELAVLASNGTPLFPILKRGVNSQLHNEPVWQTDGTTGEISVELNVAGLTATNTMLTLFAASTNVGDDRLPTSVTATLSLNTKLRIVSVIPDTVVPTLGDSSYYSIPRTAPDPQQTNTFHRFFTVKLDRPEGTLIQNVTVQLVRDSDGQNVLTLVNAGIGAPLVEQINSTATSITLKVRVTIGPENSFILNGAGPPPFHNIRYRFMVTANLNGTPLTAQRDSALRSALWRMPPGFPRFSPEAGQRDTGGDDWVAKGTYEWLLANSNLLPPINDISGEHARNLGHVAHRSGTDIDTYHFTNLLTGPRNGTKNYRRLATLTLAALRDNDQNAKTVVADWFATARSRISALAALPTVAQIIFAEGCPWSGTCIVGPPSGSLDVLLPPGWVRKLLTTGIVTDDAAGRVLNIGGSFDAAANKTIFQNDHNNHVHIDLDDSNLNNSP